MTSSKFYLLCKECEALLRARAPYKTGNLRYKAIKVEMPDAKTFIIYVDEDIAPYMKYTNEPWKRGNNPHEGWFDRAAQEIAELIAARTHGELS